MHTIHAASLDWALQHLILEGDGDLFPRPFEIDVIKGSWNALKQDLLGVDVAKHQWQPVQNVLVPKEELSFRRACQMEPLDSVLFSAITYEIGGAIEARRRPTTEQSVFSYRFSPQPDGSMYAKGNPWKDFWSTSVIRANKGQFVATLDISDFYNQIYHHAIENQLDSSGVNADLKRALLNILKLASANVSRGVPVGPHASHLLAEMSLISLDDYLHLKGYSYSRFVDDIHIFCNSHELAQAAVYEVADFLDKSQKLSLNKQKTEVLTSETFTRRASLMLVDNPINQEEKTILKIIQFHAGPYTKIVLDQLSPADLELLKNADIGGVLESYLNTESPNYVRLRWFLRRLSQTGIPSAVEYVVTNLQKLLPAIGDTAAYLNSAKDSYKGDWPQLGTALLHALQLTVVLKNEYLQIVLLSLFSRVSPLNHIGKLVQSFESYGNLAKRQIILAARETAQATPWLQNLKSSIGNMDPWQRRALLFASVQVPKDERKHWLQSIQGYLSPLEKAIADLVKTA
jgi:hypothetical protein